MEGKENNILPAAQYTQQVDPVVSRTKFDRELLTFKQVEEYNRQRGIFMLHADFPNIVLAFTAYRVRPLAFVFTVRLDFTNYDLEAPSLKFIDPISGTELRREQLNTSMLRSANNLPESLQGGQKPQQHSDLIASHPPHNIPFFCIPGIREYHNHPFHTNDPWLSHRGKGEGTLGFIVDQLHKYGTDPINNILPNAATFLQSSSNTMQVQFQGFKFSIDKIPK